ncbi:dGTPase [Microbacterium proteolyticum]|uniref:dGTPase n=1 Tax=Microbacterium proteolyticum TaxID=1572644 RepID=A0A7W5CKJ2_9MICO|nr:dNTP triphosphohydrolase [Microbacterium proteolyticum]MBB3159343.1 dGTPase [Microbacterium proteolyticum]
MTLQDETAPPAADAGASTPAGENPGARGTVQNPASRVFPDRDDARADPWSIDLERIQFSPYFSRLSAVTQVVSPSIGGAPVHNRLTHTLKVSAIARVVALQLNTRSRRAGEGEVCNATVVEAAAYAHDLGHPPFGHLGESTLDRLARTELGLADGFEGNAQTYRILTALDVVENAPRGLNLTAAVRSASAKYPWAPSVEATEIERIGAPRGIRRSSDGAYSVHKYSAYDLDLADLAEARQGVDAEPLRQSIEGAVMDLADDIAYSVHDVDDFYRAGILDHAPIAAEFRGWLDDVLEWRSRDDAEVRAELAPGAGLERLRRKMRRDDPWIADDEAFLDAVSDVDAEMVTDLLARPFDGSLTAERRLAGFTDRWIRRFQESARLRPLDTPRAGPVVLSPWAWHHVEVLKFVHKRFVLSRPDLAIQQRGMSRILARSVRALDEWLDDDRDRARTPRRLRELIALAREQYAALPAGRRPSDAEAETLARSRGIVDYVASLTDAQALALSEAISGRADRLWALGQRL